MLTALAREHGFSMSDPYRELGKEARKIILYGLKDKKVRLLYETREGKVREYEAPYEGVVKHLERRYREFDSDFQKMEIEKYMAAAVSGLRRRPLATGNRVLLNGRSIVEITALSVREAARWFKPSPTPSPSVT